MQSSNCCRALNGKTLCVGGFPGSRRLLIRLRCCRQPVAALRRTANTTTVEILASYRSAVRELARSSTGNEPSDSAVDSATGQEFQMPRSVRTIPKEPTNASRECHQRDFLRVTSRGSDTVPRSRFAERVKPRHRRDRPAWPPVPDLFDVITYFRARGDSYVLIASMGFWIGEDRKKALTARGLKLWYESELERRAAARVSIR